MIKISPSVLACDFTRLGEEVKAMENAGADMIHLDVMDGHFVRNISFGPPVIKSIRKTTDLFFDTHLMLTHPKMYIEDFVKSGSNRITFHVECSDNIQETIDTIHHFGVEVGLALSPNTPIEGILPYMDQLAQVLVMSVEPGLGGQSFMEIVLPKIKEVAKYRQLHRLNFDIQVDGGITTETAPVATACGADNLVAGSALYSQKDYTKAVRELRQAGDLGAKKLTLD